MKKSIFVILFSMTFFLAVGQDEGSAFDSYTPSSGGGGGGSELSFTSKNGHEVLPKAGDWALGVDALPFIYQLGNTFNGNTFNSSAFFDYADRNLPTLTIYGKKMVRDDFAYRGSLDIFASTATTKFRVDDDNSSEPDDYLFDYNVRSRYGATLSGGFEHRRGKSRVQGIYGAELYVHYSSSFTDQRKYANEITVNNQTPSSNFLGNDIAGDVPTPSLGYRITKIDRGSIFEVGARGIVGVEYFFAPKMSIGGEFYVGVGYRNTGGQSVTAEGFDGNDNAVREYVNASVGTSSITLGTSNTGGAINLLFYF